MVRGGVVRFVFILAAIVAQLVLLWLLISYVRHLSGILYLALEILALAEVVALTTRNRHPSYTIAWIFLFLLSPVFGLFLKLLWGRTSTQSRKSRQTAAIFDRRRQWLKSDPALLDRLAGQYPQHIRLATYLYRQGFPVYENCDCRYYPLGELQFAQLLEDLEQAERFIFMEYFILAEGELWDKVHAVLVRKAAAGVEVRLLYDDVGSMFFFSAQFKARLRREGIQVMAFGEAQRLLSRFYVNYRNHQKIAIIDGRVGYTGGTNLADEYANIYPKHGHWKDTAIRMEGPAVWSMTVTFLEMWETESGIAEDYRNYRTEPVPAVVVPPDSTSGEGFCQPFSDGPVNNPNNPAEMMYRQMIASAKRTVYITTPYLIIDDAMMDTLCMAAQGGVDVRIATPRIWDHWYVHVVTRSNYRRLVEAGVRVYEYVPGFLHAKTLICDDDHALTGSVNMDYRSFHLHFENAVWLCGVPVLAEIKQDFLDTLAVCEEVTLDSLRQISWPRRLLQSFFRLLAPLL